MKAIYTRVLFIDLISDEVIGAKLLPVQRLDVAAKAYARHLATIRNTTVMAHHEDGLNYVMPPRGQSVNTYSRPRCDLKAVA